MNFKVIVWSYASIHPLASSCGLQSHGYGASAVACMRAQTTERSLQLASCWPAVKCVWWRPLSRETAFVSAQPRTCPALINLSLADARGPRTTVSRKGEGNNYYWSANIFSNQSVRLLLLLCGGVLRCWHSVHPGAHAVVRLA